MKKILLTAMVGFLAFSAAVAQEPTRQAKKKIEAQAEKKKAEYEAMQKAKIEADKKGQTLTATPTSSKADLKTAAALTVENKNQ